MKTKKVPQRMCTGCMEMKSKKELIRIVKNKEGKVFVDLTGKKNGRGAYICKNVDCLNKALKNKKLEKNLETSIDEEIYTTLKEQIENE